MFLETGRAEAVQRACYIREATLGANDYGTWREGVVGPEIQEALMDL